jgi:glycogen synthase
LVELGVADAARVRVIPMPVNPLFLNPVPRRDRRDARLFLLTVARLTRQKSIDTLLEALSLVRAHGVDAQLQIAGDGDQRAFLENKTRELQLEAFVEFLGARPQTDLPALYARCDVFVLPSVREGMGLVLAEALLCGAPVLAAASGGVTDIVIPGETGLAFPERDTKGLAAALEQYARDAAYAAHLAQHGRALALERFTPAGVAEQFLNVYANAING